MKRHQTRWPDDPGRAPGSRASPPRPSAALFVVALLCAAASIEAGTPSDPPTVHPQGPGTKKMAARLAALAQEAVPLENPWFGGERAEVLRAKLKDVKDQKEYLRLQSMYATELLNSGRSLEAIQELTNLRQYVAEHRIELSASDQAYLAIETALSHLRQGEQENCLVRHSTESCIVPIRGSGIHTLEQGSRAAIRDLTERLSQFPDDLQARWLLNIAAMTVGDWPDKVPPRWLIPPAVFRSEAEVKPFTDVAPGLGLDYPNLAGGSIVDDFDNDGYLDIITSAWSLRGQIRYFHNNADGTFTERTQDAGLVGEVGGLNLVQADYNNDGFMDVLVLRGGWLGKAGRHPNSLLRNNGDGTFEDVTEEAGLLSFHPTQTAVWIDYNNDGFIDLFIGNESTGEEVHLCELFRNNGDGTFTECAASSGVAARGWIKGVAGGDYNNDGRMDLYVSLRDGPNLLFRNDGPQDPGTGSPKGSWRFTEVGKTAGVTEPLRSFPTWFFDYDNDGWLDIFVSGYSIKNVGDVAADYLGLPTGAERARLYHNNQDGTFADVTREAGLYKVLLTMGSNFGDIDNDGFLDLYLGTGDPLLDSIVPNRMFRNAGGRRFLDVTTSARVGHLQKGHGVSFADIDNDGDQDIFEEMGGAVSGDFYHNVLYENPGYGNHWITLKLEGVGSNRAAIGARIKVVVRTGDGERAVYKTVGSGGSFGASPLRQEIGLGRATSISSVGISWPATGTTQILKNLAMDRRYRVREGEAQAVPFTLKTFDLSPEPTGKAGTPARRN